MEKGGQKEGRKGRKRGIEEWVFDGGLWKPRSGERGRQIRSYRDLDVFNLGYVLTMEIFRVSARFPKEERYALTDQIRRSSRAICSNIAEGVAKRRHEAVFKNALNNALGEAEETKVWLDFALDCHYISEQEHQRLTTGYDQISAILWTLMNKWETYA